MITYAIAALLLSSLGCICLYLASPNQRWIAAPLRALPACVAGCVLFVLGWFVFAQIMNKLAASFVFLTVLMFVLSALPYIGALVSRRREQP